MTIGHLIAAAALLTMGLIVFGDSALRLLRAEHPSIGIVELFGREV